MTVWFNSVRPIYPMYFFPHFPSLFLPFSVDLINFFLLEFCQIKNSVKGGRYVIRCHRCLPSHQPTTNAPFVSCFLRSWQETDASDDSLVFLRHRYTRLLLVNCRRICVKFGILCNVLIASCAKETIVEYLKHVYTLTKRCFSFLKAIHFSFSSFNSNIVCYTVYARLHIFVLSFIPFSSNHLYLPLFTHISSKSPLNVPKLFSIYTLYKRKLARKNFFL